MPCPFHQQSTLFGFCFHMQNNTLYFSLVEFPGIPALTSNSSHRAFQNEQFGESTTQQLRKDSTSSVHVLLPVANTGAICSRYETEV